MFTIIDNIAVALFFILPMMILRGFFIFTLYATWCLAFTKQTRRSGIIWPWQRRWWTSFNLHFFAAFLSGCLALALSPLTWLAHLYMGHTVVNSSFVTIALATIILVTITLIIALLRMWLDMRIEVGIPQTLQNKKMGVFKTLKASEDRKLWWHMSLLGGFVRLIQTVIALFILGIPMLFIQINTSQNIFTTINLLAQSFFTKGADPLVIEHIFASLTAHLQHVPLLYFLLTGVFSACFFTFLFVAVYLLRAAVVVHFHDIIFVNNERPNHNKPPPRFIM